MAKRIRRSASLKARVDDLASMSDGTIFGHTVWYSMREADTTYDAFDVAKNAAGIDADSPSHRTEKSAFLKAMASLDRDVRSKGYLVRKLDDTGEEINYILISESKLKDGAKGDRLRYVAANVFTFDKLNIALKVEKDLYRGDAKRLYEFFSETMISKDIRTWMIARIKEMNAIMLRPGGGIYFVPEIHTAELTQLENFVGGIGASALFKLPVRMTKAEKATMGTVAISSLTSELKDLERSIPDDLDKARASTVKASIASFGELKAKALYYSTAFEISIDELNVAIAATTKKLHAVASGPVIATVAHKKLKKNRRSIEELEAAFGKKVKKIKAKKVVPAVVEDGEDELEDEGDKLFE